MSRVVLDKLRERFQGAILETHSELGDDTAVVDASRWKEICTFLRQDPALDFDLPVDLCGVDYPNRVPRMEVVMHLYSIARRHRLRLKTRVGDAEMAGAELESVTSIWAGMNWLEREVFDMSGVTFRGHPDLRRILMYPEFEGHPLRKDYPAERTQPLVTYRTEEEVGMPLGKLAPFGPDEGMSFGRKVWPPHADRSAGASGTASGDGEGGSGGEGTSEAN
jgi:NADH-quinone oxidoreductase subunit C